MEKDTTVIDLQYKFRIKVEKPSEFGSSLFKVSYQEAFKKLGETLNFNKINNDQNNFDSYSNVICFTGERGRGKTSTMVSFKDSLINKESDNQLSIYFDGFYNNEKRRDSHIQDKFYNTILESKFCSLPVIDPSLFRGSETLIEIVLAQMFAKFRERIEDENYNSKKLDNGLKKQLIHSFQEVYKKIQSLNNVKKNEDGDALDALLLLADSTNIRNRFTKLVAEYVKFFDNSDYLIICLDDIDFKIENNYLMLEDIRQILINSKTILLSTFKYDQLFESINYHFKNQLNSTISEIRTQLYLNKIFPQNRCVEIGELNQLIELSNRLQIIDGNEVILDTNLYKNIFLKATKLNSSLSNSYEDVIRKFLWDKYEIIFPKKENRQNYILPKTVRELLVFLNPNDTIEAKVNELINYSFNLVTSKEHLEILNELKSVDRNSSKIFIVKCVKELIKIEEFSNINDERLFLLLNATTDSNVSIADIATLIYLLEISEYGRKNRLFVDVLEFTYSLFLFVKNIDISSPEIYNGILKIKTYNEGWIIFNNEKAFDHDSRLLVHYVGKYDYKKHYREQLSSPFYAKYNNNNRYAVFTPLSLLGNIIFGYFKNNELKKASYVHDIMPKKMISVLKVFQNPSFVKAFTINYIKTRLNFEAYNINATFKSKAYNDMIYRTDEALEITYNQLNINIRLTMADLVNSDILNSEYFDQILPALIKSSLVDLINNLEGYKNEVNAVPYQSYLGILENLENIISSNEIFDRDRLKSKIKLIRDNPRTSRSIISQRKRIVDFIDELIEEVNNYE